jgi:hypothetical protein
MKFMMHKMLAASVVLGGLVGVQAQQTAAQPSSQGAAHQGAAQPKIQVNFLNTCRPAPADADEMARGLARVKDRPSFTSDFEISRGITTLSEVEARAAGAPAGSGTTPSGWVRIRHEFPEKAVLTDVQYSISVDGDASSEVLAMHMRDSREVLQILISDSVVGSPAQVVKLNTPPDRIRIERFGKSSIVLARCGAVDQSSYEPIFASAHEILEKYRTAMAVQSVVPAELARLPTARELKVRRKNPKAPPGIINREEP